MKMNRASRRGTSFPLTASVSCARAAAVLAAVLIAASFIVSCSTIQAPEFRYEAHESRRLQKLFAAIDDRNRTVKRSPPWLARAYERMQIRRLGDLSAGEYADYRRFVAADGEVYIIVHPGFFPFFDVWDIPGPAPVTGREHPDRNLVERIADGIQPSATEYRTALMQERILRDFLEYMSEARRLVILVLPRDYRQHVTYRTLSPYDEYARYINDITNMGESIVYLESATHDQGSLLEPEMQVLVQFLRTTGVRKVLLGGGFIGKCLDGFYTSLKRVTLPGFVFYVPELTVFSPTDMKQDKVRLVTADGSISRKSMYRYFETFSLDPVTEEVLPWTAFPLYNIEQYR